MRVDIGVPVFNGGSKLSRALTALRGQTHRDIRIFVSDNGSSDNSMDVVREHAQQDSRVIALDGPVDRKAASNFTLLLRASDAPIFMWAAHDDLWDPQFVEAGLSALATGRSYFSSNWWVGDIESKVGVAVMTHPLSFIESESRAERTIRFANLNPLTHKCNLVYALFRRRFLEEAYAMHDISNDGLLSLAVCSLAPGVTTDRILFFKDNAQEARNARLAKRFQGKSRNAAATVVSAAAGVVGSLRPGNSTQCTFTDYKVEFYTRAGEMLPEYREVFLEISDHHGRFSRRDQFVPNIDSRIRIAEDLV